MKTTTIKIDNFNPEYVTFSKIIVNKKLQKKIYIGYKDPKSKKRSGSILSLETPKVFCPFGISSYPPEGKPENKAYSVNFNLNDDDTVLSTFKGKLDRLRERLVDHLVTLTEDKEQSKHVFKDFGIGKKDQKNTEKMKTIIESKVRGLYKESTNEKYPDSMKLKVYNYNNNLLSSLDVYQDGESSEEEKQRLERNKKVSKSERKSKPRTKVTNITYDNVNEEIPRGNHVLVFRLNPVYFISGSSGIPLSLTHMVLENKSVNDNKPSFLDEDSDEEEDVEETNQENTEVVEESDNEETLSDSEIEDEDL